MKGNESISHLLNRRCITSRMAASRVSRFVLLNRVAMRHAQPGSTLQHCFFCHPDCHPHEDHSGDSILI
jgi:hypothetical protein